MNNKTTLIKDAVVVTSKSCIPADILIKDGKIDALLTPGAPCEADQTIDAKGRYVMPGCVDGHTHMMDPGNTDREEFSTGTMAAAVGGTTTIVDHHRNVPAVYDVQAHLDKIQFLEGKSCVDYGFMGGISPTNTKELQAMWNAGVVSFKTFTCNLHGVKAMHTSYLVEAFTEVARFNGTVLIHCEDDGICQYNEERLKAEGRTDYMSQIEWRSKLAERIAAKTVVEVAKATNCRVIVAHVSQPEILQVIHEAQEEGYEIYAESCAHYFNLTYEDLAEKGPWVKFTPPMNSAGKREELWKLFDRGYVTTMGSDHCPYPKSDKIPGEKNIWDAPNGIPGVETSLKAMLNGVNEGRTTLNRIVECMCENPAKVYGLFPRKGHIEVGADADLVILDMDKVETIRNENIVSKCGWSAFEGKTFKGAADTVILRGTVIAEGGVFKGEVGYGKFTAREESCLK